MSLFFLEVIMFVLDGSKLNRLKLIHAYFKKENIDFNETDRYYAMSDETLEEMIKSKYKVIGDLNWKSMEKAKLVDSLKTEYEEQKEVVRWCRENKIPVQSSGNGFALDTKNNINYIAKLKASGMSLGYPDLDVFIGKGVSVHIEMKREKNGVVSDMQKRWIDWFNNNGYYAKVCYGSKDAIDFIKKCIDKNQNL